MASSVKDIVQEKLMQNSDMVTLGINVLFSLIVAASYIMYGIAFNRLGGFPEERTFTAFAQYAFTVFISPYFIAGLVLALGGSLVRMAMFSLIGITRSALAAELSLIMMLIASAIVFQEMPRFPKDYLGGLFILIGSYIVAS